jgi:translation initiation factor 2 beta subunit (eIF-2beta)/eIF-5
VIQFSIIKFDKGKKKTKKPTTEEKPSEVAKEKPVDNDARYKKLLERIREELHKNNPALAEKVKIQVNPPDIERLPKKICIKNFGTICAQIDRPMPHVMNFFLSELGAEGSLAGEQLSMLKC